MKTRYVLERVAGGPNSRRIKDLLRNKYIKNNHGNDVFEKQEARTKADELNQKWNAYDPLLRNSANGN